MAKHPLQLRVSMNASLKESDSFFDEVKRKLYLMRLDKYGEEGVKALREATPVRTGLTRDSWSYEVVSSKYGYKIVWKNSNVVNGVNVAVLIQYGHGTRNGGYVEGIDYINPALRPVFEKIANDIWRKVIDS